MASSYPDPESMVLRPSWHAAAAIGPIVAIVFVMLALVFDDSIARAVVSGVVFGLVFGLIDRRRTVELTDTGATANDLWRQRSIARAEVRDVARGQWWNGGIRLSTGGQDFWLRVCDRPFGRVSDQRLSVVADWAAITDADE